MRAYLVRKTLAQMREIKLPWKIDKKHVTITSFELPWKSGI